MNKKVLIVIGVVLLLALGGWFYMNSKKANVAPATETATGTQQPSAATSLKDLITKGIAQTCTFTNDGTSGSVYVSGGAVRGDFDTVANGATTKSHMIVKDNSSYIWTDGQTTGIKMTYDPNATPAASASATSGSFDAGANMNYKCSAWLADSGKFTLPTGVTFTSFTPPSTGATSSQCSYCDSLTGDSKTQCLTALKCSQ